jgi:hypothetical protein
LDVPEITEVQEHVAPRVLAFQLAFDLVLEVFQEVTLDPDPPPRHREGIGRIVHRGEFAEVPLELQPEIYP